MLPRFNHLMMLFILLICAVMLTACGSTQVVKETQVVLLAPPDNLLQDCKPTTPPAKEKYVESNTKEREELLTEFGRGQTAVVRQCNKDKKSLREWVIKETENQKKAEKEKNASRK